MKRLALIMTLTNIMAAMVSAESYENDRFLEFRGSGSDEYSEFIVAINLGNLFKFLKRDYIEYETQVTYNPNEPGKLYAQAGSGDVVSDAPLTQTVTVREPVSRVEKTKGHFAKNWGYYLGGAALAYSGYEYARRGGGSSEQRSCTLNLAGSDGAQQINQVCNPAETVTQDAGQDNSSTMP